MQVQATIQKWGNSLALRLTGQLRTIPHFEENMRVNIEIQEEGIQVRPARDKLKKKLFREADLLRGLNAWTAHADELMDVSPKEFGG